MDTESERFVNLEPLAMDTNVPIRVENAAKGIVVGQVPLNKSQMKPKKGL